MLLGNGDRLGDYVTHCHRSPGPTVIRGSPITSAQQLLTVPMTLHLLTYGDTVRLVIGWVT